MNIEIIENQPKFVHNGYLTTYNLDTCFDSFDSVVQLRTNNADELLARIDLKETIPIKLIFPDELGIKYEVPIKWGKKEVVDEGDVIYLCVATNLMKEYEEG